MTRKLTIRKMEFNLRFLAELTRYGRDLKHQGTGSGGKHPLLRRVLLQQVKQDIAIDGWQAALIRWSRFIGLDLDELHLLEQVEKDRDNYLRELLDSARSNSGEQPVLFSVQAQGIRDGDFNSTFSREATA